MVTRIKIYKEDTKKNANTKMRKGKTNRKKKKKTKREKEKKTFNKTRVTQKKEGIVKETNSNRIGWMADKNSLPKDICSTLEARKKGVKKNKR